MSKQPVKGVAGTEFITADKLAALDLNELYNLIAEGKYSEAMHKVKAYLAKLGVYIHRVNVLIVDVEYSALLIVTPDGTRLRVAVPQGKIELF